MDNVDSQLLGFDYLSQMASCQETRGHVITFTVLTAAAHARTPLFLLIFIFLTMTEAMEPSQLPGKNPDLHISPAHYH